MRISKAAPFFAVTVALSAGAGLLYAVLTNGQSWLAGVIYGSCIGCIVSLVERGLVLGGLQERIRRWPTPLYVPACELGCVVLACIGFAVGGTINWSAGLIPDRFSEAVVPSLQVLVYALLIAALLVFIARVRDLLGHDVLTSLLIGRYHRPVEEERIFLFLDLVGSTTYARRNGDLRAQDYLGAVFAAIAEPVRAHGGTIDDYVGDMALITWRLPQGLHDARCVRCIFAVQERFEREADLWHRRFGQVPRFHAALHGGSVVTAEIGIDRHKITYFGDVVNTTARIETLSRQLQVAVLVSSDLLNRLPSLPDFVSARPLGSHVVKERSERLDVFALERSEPASVRTAVRGWKRRVANA